MHKFWIQWKFVSLVHDRRSKFLFNFFFKENEFELNCFLVVLWFLLFFSWFLISVWRVREASLILIFCFINRTWKLRFGWPVCLLLIILFIKDLRQLFVTFSVGWLLIESDLLNKFFQIGHSVSLSGVCSLVYRWLSSFH